MDQQGLGQRLQKKWLPFCLHRAHFWFPLEAASPQFANCSSEENWSFYLTTDWGLLLGSDWRQQTFDGSIMCIIVKSFPEVTLILLLSNTIICLTKLI